MTASPTIVDTRRRPAREDRAATAFTLVAVFHVVVLVAYGGILGGFPLISRLASAGGVVLMVAVLLAAAIGLASHRSWATAVVTPMLWLLVLGGLVSFLLALSRVGLDIPIVAGLAIWALAAPATVARAPMPIGGGVLLGAMVLSSISPLLVGLGMQPGGPLIAAPSDLQLTTAASGGCSDAEAPPGNSAPPMIDVVVSWSWARGDVFALGSDTVNISWTTTRPDGLSGYALDSVHPLDGGIIEANRSIGEGEGILFALDLAERGYAPGAVAITLRRPNNVPVGHGWVNVVSQYAHGPSDTSDQDGPTTWLAISRARCGW